MKKNKITTLGYFTKRLKDNGFVVWKIFNKYGDHDHRIWTILINPGEESVFTTCYINTDEVGSIPVFEIHDGNSIFRNYAKIQTRSMEIIIKTLLDRGVKQTSESYRKDQDPISNYEINEDRTRPEPRNGQAEEPAEEKAGEQEDSRRAVNS
mgnify:CR=1 FL=1